MYGRIKHLKQALSIWYIGRELGVFDVKAELLLRNNPQYKEI